MFGFLEGCYESPTHAELDSCSDSSDVGARSQAADTPSAAMHEGQNSRLFQMPYRSSGAPMSSTPPQFASARSLMTPRLTQVGPSMLQSNGVNKQYDKDGWATGTRTAAASRATPANNQSSVARPKPTSSFMDQYRLSKNALAHENITMNGLLGLPRAKTDIKSFQSKNEESLKGFMSMLPADVGPSSRNYAPVASHGHSRSSGGSINNNNISNSSKSKDNHDQSNTQESVPKRRLGVGRSRKG
jgi:hypothetical protein